jgi:hypothetical protein
VAIVDQYKLWNEWDTGGLGDIMKNTILWPSKIILLLGFVVIAFGDQANCHLIFL